ncbi:glycerol kinase GlpK [Companilactobacillus metriopterae]|uniref:glycerol kinase GlpK n=1 Tax=Companilactobacillus metriopterae TaxID=1909267 RepID=UPI00100C1E91|nr:glycerol kinase GlpK [Companilactobacillus metriopterae]
MGNEYILSIDEGTTTTRAIIFDHDGNKIVSSRRTIDAILPNPGWVEQDPNQIWNAVQSTIAMSLIESGVKPDEIKSIGIANQRETTVIWDKETGKPIYNAIVWQSRQTADLANKINSEDLKIIRNKTGLVVSPYFSATKIRFILDTVPGAQEKAEAGQLMFGTINTWLLWKLTDGKSFKTDVSNASRTMLFNIDTLDWDDDLLKMFNIPKAMMPEVTSNSEIFGYSENNQFYGATVPISGMMGSQQASLFGQMAFEPGMVKNTYGTGAFAVMNTGTTKAISDNRLLTTVAYKIGDKVNYALEGSIFVAGAALQWLQDEMELIKSSEQSSEMAQNSENQNEVYVVPSFSGLGAPYWDDLARGAIFGLTRGTTDADLVKATLQSIAYQSKDIIETMSSDSNIPIQSIRVDGSASQNEYLMQFQSDILGIPIQKSNEMETTSLGAAFMAGLAVGFWKDLDEIRTVFKHGEEYVPTMKEDQRDDLYSGWKNAVEATMMFKHTK